MNYGIANSVDAARRAQCETPTAILITFPIESKYLTRGEWIGFNKISKLLNKYRYQ